MHRRAVVRCACGKGLRVHPDLVGRRVQCPYCQAQFFVPKVEADPLAKVKSSLSAVPAARKQG